MLDDVETMLSEAKAEIAHNLELANCLRDQESESAWRKECLSMFETWHKKWFGNPDR
jgi:hypothetical protein